MRDIRGVYCAVTFFLAILGTGLKTSHACCPHSRLSTPPMRASSSSSAQVMIKSQPTSGPSHLMMISALLRLYL